MLSPDSPGIIRQDTPTIYFVGVTTGQSSINTLFPLWAQALGLAGARLVGENLPMRAPRERYRRVVRQIKMDPLSFGALVTTHKIDLLAAARDLFDELDEYAGLCEEVSGIYKRDGLVVGHAADPITSGQAMAQFIEPGYWKGSGAEVMCIGAGGAGLAITTYFLTRRPPDDRPGRVLIVDRDRARLDHLNRVIAKLSPAGLALDLIWNDNAQENDRLMSTLTPGSMVINATGMGKDLPGSPISDHGLFPLNGIAWELNYRGDLEFLHQAKAQSAARRLSVQDGWYYFLVGWAHIIGVVFHVEISPAAFEQLAQIAAGMQH